MEQGSNQTEDVYYKAQVQEAIDISRSREEVTLSLVDYEQLVEDQSFLNCLEAAGVDNWEGYKEALSMYREDTD